MIMVGKVEIRLIRLDGSAGLYIPMYLKLNPYKYTNKLNNYFTMKKISIHTTQYNENTSLENKKREM